MAYQIFQLPKATQIDTSVRVVPGAKAYFFATLSSTPQDTYTTDARNVAHQHPVEADANGVFPPIYLDPSLRYKLTLNTAADVLIYSVDPVNDQVLSQAIIGGLLYPQTASELAASVTPVNYFYPPGNVFRYKSGSLSVAVTEDWTDAIQDAMDSNTEVFFPSTDCISGTFYGISSPLYVTDDQSQNLTLVGGGRVNTYLHPLSVDISDGLGINAMIINQAGDRKFSARNLRFWSGVSYTGVAFYCVEGAGGGTVEAVFSGSFDNCWFGLDSANGGILKGGFSNYRVTNNTWEFAKTCVILEGAGNGDIVFDNNRLFQCYDQFISKTDAEVGNLITCTNLVAYNHQRGQLFSLRNCYDVQLSNICVQANAPPTTNTVGLFLFNGVTSFQVNNFSALYNTTLGTGTLGECITITNSFGEFSNGRIDGADVGIRFTGSSANDVTFDNVNVLRSVTAGFRVQTGTPSGVVRLNNCNISDGTLHLVTFTSEASFDFYVNGCRFMNAGLGGSGGARNFAVNTTGSCRVNDTTIGQNNGSAAAAHYVAADSSGTVEFNDTDVVGTPPTSLKTGAQTVMFRRKRGPGGTVASIAAVTLPFNGDVFVISGTTNITSMTATDCDGRTVTLIFQDVLTFTDGSNLKLAGNFVTSADDTITLCCDGTSWFETGRSAN